MEALQRWSLRSTSRHLLIAKQWGTEKCVREAKLGACILFSVQTQKFMHCRYWYELPDNFICTPVLINILICVNYRLLLPTYSCSDTRYFFLVRRLMWLHKKQWKLLQRSNLNEVFLFYYIGWLMWNRKYTLLNKYTLKQTLISFRWFVICFVKA